MAQPSLNAVLIIKEGPHAGEVLDLPIHSCRVIGRSLDDIHQTRVLGRKQIAAVLDEETQHLIRRYLGAPSSALPVAPDAIGNFKRLSDWVLDDPAVSRLHAILFHESHGVGILDLSSRNGTRVNGERTESCLLKKGDEIQIGSTRLLVGSMI